MMRLDERRRPGTDLAGFIGFVQTCGIKCQPRHIMQPVFPLITDINARNHRAIALICTTRYAPAFAKTRIKMARARHHLPIPDGQAKRAIGLRDHRIIVITTQPRGVEHPVTGGDHLQHHLAGKFALPGMGPDFLDLEDREPLWPA